MKKEKKVLAITLMAFSALSPIMTRAQQADSVRQLDEVVITATRSDQPIIDVPRSITVVNRAMIENSGHNSVGELLATQPGIFIVGTNQNPGTNQSIFMRGANSNQVVVLIDGMRITDPSSPNATIDLSELSLTNVERIEIIRGAHSTLYGGAAIGGAINIITKKGGLTGFHGSVQLQAGTYGKKTSSTTENITLNYAFKNGFYINGSLFRQDVRGLNATQDTITSSVYKTADRDNFSKTDGYVKAGYQYGKWDAHFSFKNVSQDADIDDRAFDDDDNAYLEFDRQLVDAKASYRINDKISISYIGSWSSSIRNSVNDSSIANANGDYDKTYSSGKYYGDLLTNEVEANYQSGNLRGIIGLGQYHEDMHFQTYYFSNAFGFPYVSEVNYDSLNTSANTMYIFGQVNYEYKNVAVTGGFRYSNHSRFGQNRTFEISPSYRIEDLILYGSFSTGFNAPSLYQLLDPSIGFGSFGPRGNKRLAPEESNTIELGLKKEYANGNYITVAAFHSDTKNAIEYVYLWNRETALSELTYLDYFGDTYLNVTRQRVNGVEASGHIALGKFYMNGNISYIDSEISFSSADLDQVATGGNHVQLYNYGSFVDNENTTANLARRPAFTGFAELGYKPVSKLTLSTTLRHTGSRFDVGYDPDLGPYGALGQTNVKRYNLIDAGFSWQAHKSWTITGKVENILNEEFREILGFNTRGRSGYLKVIYRW